MRAKLDQMIVVRVGKPLLREVEEAAWHLDLKESEVVRRGLRIGLKTLLDFQIPGGGENRVRAT